jgi:hypothetical protein
MLINICTCHYYCLFIYGDSEILLLLASKDSVNFLQKGDGLTGSLVSVSTLFCSCRCLLCILLGMKLIWKFYFMYPFHTYFTSYKIHNIRNILVS